MAASEPTFEYPHYLPSGHRAPPSRRPVSTGLSNSSP
jgi:hypothetical protein